jgi:glycerol kinase
MILGLDISTSITGATVIDENGKVIHKIWELDDTFFIKEVYIEQSLQSFRSGFSSAKTLSTLSRFNGVVSWLCYDILKLKPEYIAATSARKKCGIKVPKGTKAKQVIIQYVLDNVPSVLIEYTKHGNPKPHCFDKADSWVIANAGYICQTEKSAQS